MSVCLSVRFFVDATGHSFGAILTLNGSNDVLYLNWVANAVSSKTKHSINQRNTLLAATFD